MGGQESVGFTTVIEEQSVISGEKSHKVLQLGRLSVWLEDESFCFSRESNQNSGAAGPDFEVTLHARACSTVLKMILLLTTAIHVNSVNDGTEVALPARRRTRNILDGI